MKLVVEVHRDIMTGLEARSGNAKFVTKSELVRHVLLDYFEMNPVDVVKDSAKIVPCDCLHLGAKETRGAIGCALAFADRNGTEAKDPCVCSCHQ